MERGWDGKCSTAGWQGVRRLAVSSAGFGRPLLRAPQFGRPASCGTWLRASGARAGMRRSRLVEGASRRWQRLPPPPSYNSRRSSSSSSATLITATGTMYWAYQTTSAQTQASEQPAVSCWGPSRPASTSWLRSMGVGLNLRRRGGGSKSAWRRRRRLARCRWVGWVDASSVVLRAAAGQHQDC